jgi:hypothetical protein
MSDLNKSIPQDATNRQPVNGGGKPYDAASSAKFYDQPNDSVGRAHGGGGKIPDHSFPKDTCGVQK